MKIEVLFKSMFLVLVGIVSLIKAYQESQVQSPQAKLENPPKEIEMQVSTPGKITDYIAGGHAKKSPSPEVSGYVYLVIGDR